MACQSFDEIIAKLEQDANFTKAFLAVYPDGYSEQNITNAIEEFEKTLLTPNSRFDLYLKGEKTAINDIEPDTNCLRNTIVLHVMSVRHWAASLTN